MSKLLSFHNKQSIKDEYIARVKAHYIADEIVHGKYWDNGKGCAVGCTVHSSSHAAYEKELGIPRILAKLEDRIFEGISNGEAKEFPLQFLEAIPVGVDLEPVWRKFFAWMLEDKDHGVIRFAKTDSLKKAIQDVADAFKDSLVKEVPYDRWMSLRKVCREERAAAADAAYAAADARENHYKAMKNKLLKLLKEADKLQRSINH